MEKLLDHNIQITQLWQLSRLEFYEIYGKIEDWCDENLHGNWDSFPSFGNAMYCWTFAEMNDVVLFKLRFGGLYTSTKSLDKYLYGPGGSGLKPGPTE